MQAGLFPNCASMVFLASSTLFFLALFQAPPAPFLALFQASHVEAASLLSGLLSFKPLWGLGCHWLCAFTSLPHQFPPLPPLAPLPPPATQPFLLHSRWPCSRPRTSFSGETSCPGNQFDSCKALSFSADFSQ